MHLDGMTVLPLTHLANFINNLGIQGQPLRLAFLLSINNLFYFLFTYLTIALIQ